MELKTFKAGEIIVQKGEKSRELFFLFEGVVEVSTEDEEGSYVLNEMHPPGVFGDFAFFYGLPRTATVKAKTDLELFTLKYEDDEYKVKELPELIKPIFETLIERINNRDKKIIELEKVISDLKNRLDSTENH
jgi:CRP-like cAMP-binding protein